MRKQKHLKYVRNDKNSSCNSQIYPITLATLIFSNVLRRYCSKAMEEYWDRSEHNRRKKNARILRQYYTGLQKKSVLYL